MHSLLLDISCHRKNLIFFSLHRLDHSKPKLIGGTFRVPVHFGCQYRLSLPLHACRRGWLTHIWQFLCLFSQSRVLEIQNPIPLLWIYQDKFVAKFCVNSCTQGSLSLLVSTIKFIQYEISSFVRYCLQQICFLF